uniref:Fibronectin type-III domain-containing protein n=1 Tax=Hippocampus comes TaxID=109280 RepID=A0A3Q2Y4I3_HIPCM
TFMAKLCPALVSTGLKRCSLAAGSSSACGVTCSTDYNVLLNCSCASVPARPLRLDVNCSDGELHVSDSCQVSPPQSWCVMYPPELYSIAAIGTECTATVGRPGAPERELSSWALYDMVKPSPPFNVRVISADGFYNITWDLDNDNNDCLTYSLRIRTSRGLLQDPTRSFSVDERFLVVGHKELPPRAKCSAVVRAKLCPSNPSQGPWSEWSPKVSWTNAATTSADVAGKQVAILFIGKQADHHLRCEWVRPKFSEHDLLGNTSHVEMATATLKQLHCHIPNPEGEDVVRPAGCLLLVPAPLAQLGHVSIHTVIVSEEDEQQVPGPNFRELLDSDREEREVDRQDEERLFNDWPEEVERASLASSRQSDDGYPRVDLDTVDSGFGECTSPSHSSSGEPAGVFLPDPQSSRSNYVKQWMMCGDAGEDLRDVLH